MQTYDIIMLVVLVGTGFWGAMKGFVWQLASIVSVSLSYWVALNFREPFSQQIEAEPPWNKFLAMFILFVGTMLAIWMVFRMIARTIDNLKLKEFDRTLGALFGAAKGAIFCVLVTMFAVSLLGDSVKTKIVESKSGYYISKFLDHSEKVIPPEIHDVIGPHLQRFDEQLRAADSGSSALPFDTDRQPAAPFSWPTSSTSPNQQNRGVPAGQSPADSSLRWPDAQQAQRAVQQAFGNR